MFTKLQICNSALNYCGNEPIDSLTDNNKRAKAVLAQYDLTLRDLLNDTPWNFAVSRDAILIKSTDTPAYGYASKYEIPADVIRVLELYCEAEFRREGEYILTNATWDELKAKCIMDVTDPTKFSANFVKVFALKLAEDISYALVQSTPLKQSISADLERYLRKARSYNSQEGTPQDMFGDGVYTGGRL